MGGSTSTPAHDCEGQDDVLTVNMPVDEVGVLCALKDLSALSRDSKWHGLRSASGMIMAHYKDVVRVAHVWAFVIDCDGDV